MQLKDTWFCKYKSNSL